jgi:hypothetical protein
MLLRKRVVRAKLDIYVCTTCGFEENNLHLTGQEYEVKYIVLHIT